MRKQRWFSGVVCLGFAVATASACSEGKKKPPGDHGSGGHAGAQAGAGGAAGAPDDGGSTEGGPDGGGTEAGLDGGGGSAGDGSVVSCESFATPPLTDQVTLTPDVARLATPDTRDPRVVADRQAMLDEHFGDVSETAGEPHHVRTLAGSAAPPAPGPAAKLLARFVHMPDLQLGDDESPTRVAAVDAPGSISPAFRPHDAYLCNMTNALVRSVNAIHGAKPLDFVLLGGDNADSAQQNELDWVLGLLDGKAGLECDSGADDDPKPGPGNDPKDPFDAAGLAVPWYWVTGNHDVLVQGNFPTTPDREALAVGTAASLGTRDWSKPGGPITNGTVPADPRRTLVSRQKLMEQVRASGDGHGIGDDQVASGLANYTFDVGEKLRFLVIDTANETGCDRGIIRTGDIDGFIRPALETAETDGKWVVLTSHHSTGRLESGKDCLGGTEQPDAVTRADWEALITSFPNVLFSLVGHSHVHQVREIGDPAEHRVWEVMTASLADYPNQARVMEIWDQDNGHVMLRGTAFDFSVECDPVAAEGRALATLDFVSAWGDDGRGKIEDRNIEVWAPLP